MEEDAWNGMYGTRGRRKRMLSVRKATEEKGMREGKEETRRKKTLWKERRGEEDGEGNSLKMRGLKGDAQAEILEKSGQKSWRGGIPPPPPAPYLSPTWE